MARDALVYVGACPSVAGEYWTQWTAEPNGLLDAVFLVSLPLVLLTMVGSTVLGTTLLVRGYRPRATAVLLAVAFPAALLIGTVTSMGSIVLPDRVRLGASPVAGWPARSCNAV